MNSLINKANVLVEALPYIQRFRNSIMVVKFGGSSMEDPALVASTMRDIVLLEAVKPFLLNSASRRSLSNS